MAIQQLPRELSRHAVYLSLRAARLPVDAGERLIHHDEDSGSIVGRAFDDFEAAVKIVAGSVLRDDEMTQEGRRERLRTTQLRKADDLETVPESERAEADQEFSRRRQRSAQQRREAEETLVDQIDETDERRQERKEAAARAETTRKRRIKQDEQGAKGQAAQRARKQRPEELRREEAALEKQRTALDAEQDVLETTKELDRSKQSRRNAS